jgi:hypothetical protein
MSKRFTDAELAAEWFRAECNKRNWTKDRRDTLRRFCLLAHYDLEMEAIPIYHEKPTLFMVEAGIRRMEKQETCPHGDISYFADLTYECVCGKQFTTDELDELEWDLEG